MTGDRRAPVRADIGYRLAQQGWAYVHPRKPFAGMAPPGTVSWEEHCQAWEARANQFGLVESPEGLANRGGFSYSELTMFLGRDPKTWEPTNQQPEP